MQTMSEEENQRMQTMSEEENQKNKVGKAVIMLTSDTSNYLKHNPELAIESYREKTFTQEYAEKNGLIFYEFTDKLDQKINDETITDHINPTLDELIKKKITSMDLCINSHGSVNKKDARDAMITSVVVNAAKKGIKLHTLHGMFCNSDTPGPHGNKDSTIEITGKKVSKALSKAGYEANFNLTGVTSGYDPSYETTSTFFEEKNQKTIQKDAQIRYENILNKKFSELTPEEEEIYLKERERRVNNITNKKKDPLTPRSDFYKSRVNDAFNKAKNIKDQKNLFKELYRQDKKEDKTLQQTLKC